jgi:adenosyl cobinamide kinase/adenosyl cobinamide phosphate guanylyltransferase
MGDDITIINSVATDVEIVKAVISILSTVLTSSQYIATGTYVDRKDTDRVVNERKRKEAEINASEWRKAFDGVTIKH